MSTITRKADLRIECECTNTLFVVLIWFFIISAIINTVLSGFLVWKAPEDEGINWWISLITSPVIAVFCIRLRRREIPRHGIFDLDGESAVITQRRGSSEVGSYPFANVTGVFIEPHWMTKITGWMPGGPLLWPAWDYWSDILLHRCTNPFKNCGRFGFFSLFGLLGLVYFFLFSSLGIFEVFFGVFVLLQIERFGPDGRDEKAFKEFSPWLQIQLSDGSIFRMGQGSRKDLASVAQSFEGLGLPGLELSQGGDVTAEP